MGGPMRSTAAASLAALALLLAPALMLPGASLPLPALPVSEVELPCAELADVELAQGAVCGAWSRLADLPAPREGLALVWLEASAKALAFGGRDAAGNAQGNVWLYDPDANAWSQRTSGPARADAAFVAERSANKAWLFGGRDASGARSDVWRYDVDADTWTSFAPSSGPSARFGMAAAWDQTKFRLTIFGGTNGAQTFGEHWVYTPASGLWTHLLDGPAARSFPAGTWDQARQGIIFHGGLDASGQELSDTWFFSSGPVVEWQRLADSPAPRAHAPAGWDFRHAFLHVFGGQSGGAPSVETRLLIPSRGLWVWETDLASSRVDAAASYNLGTEQLLLAGGRTAAGPTGEFWALAPSPAYIVF